VVIVLVVVFGVAYVAWPRGETPITEAQALEQFRAHRTDTVGSAGKTPARRTPAPGVYAYETTGSADVKLGPLPTQARELPSIVTAVVTPARSGCFTYTLNFLAEHVEESTYCVEPDGSLVLESQRKHEKIGALSPEAKSTCDPNVLLATEAGKRPLACTLAMSAATIDLQVQLEGTATAEPETTVAVAGQEVRARRITIELDARGDLHGHWRERIWFASADHLPVKIERDITLSGPATFSEHSTAHLRDLSPQT